MTNLNKWKKDKEFNTSKDYDKESVIHRSAKNKAAIATTSLLIGGGVFVGLLVPGLLPVVMAGAPILAMSTNVAVSGLAATAVVGTHYLVNRNEKKMIKASKNFSRGYKEEFDSILQGNTDANSASERPKNTEIERGDDVRSRYSSKLWKVMEKNKKIEEKGHYSERLTRKEDRLRNELQMLNKSRKAAKDLYNEDLEKLRGSRATNPNANPNTNPANGSNPSNSSTQENEYIPSNHPIIPSKNNSQSGGNIIDADYDIVDDETAEENKGLKSRISDKLESFKNRFSSKPGFLKRFKLNATPEENTPEKENTDNTPGDVAGQTVAEVPNNIATKKIRTMLNLETPTLEDNAKVFKAVMNLTDETPSCKETSEGKVIPLKAGTKTIILPAAHTGIDKVINNANSKFLDFEGFTYKNDSDLPMADGFKGIIKVEFGNPKKQFVYKLNDYQKFISKPLFIITSIIDNYSDIKDCGEIKLSSSFVDKDGKEIESAYNFETKITSFEDALKKRDIIYTDMLKNIYEKQKDAYLQSPKVVTKLSGLDIVNAICKSACPKCDMTKEKIVEGLRKALSYRNVEFNEEFFKNQFINSSYDRIMNGSQNIVETQKENN